MPEPFGKRILQICVCMCAPVCVCVCVLLYVTVPSVFIELYIFVSSNHAELKGNELLTCMYCDFQATKYCVTELFGGDENRTAEALVGTSLYGEYMHQLTVIKP